MPKLTLAITAVAAALVVPALAQSPGPPDSWTIDPGHSAARFSVKHLAVSTVRGSLGKVTGTITYDGKTVESIKADVRIDLSSINTDNDNRDKDLKSGNFFDIAKYPTVAFKSKGVQSDGQGKFNMTGDLTMHGVTKEVTLAVEGPSPALKQGPDVRVGASATTTLDRRQWGLLYSRAVELTPIVGDDIQVQIDVEATKRS